MAIGMLVEVVAAILWEFDRNTGGDIGQRQRILTAWEVYQNRPLVYASVWNGHGTVIVALWYMIKRSDGGKYL